MINPKKTQSGRKAQQPKTPENKTSVNKNFRISILYNTCTIALLEMFWVYFFLKKIRTQTRFGKTAIKTPTKKEIIEYGLECHPILLSYDNE